LDSREIDLSVRIGGLTLPNPILVASGTFGYAQEMERWVDVHRLGGFVPKTITPLPRAGNAPWRTVETSAGMLNSIGLDNDGIDGFLTQHLPHLGQLRCPLIVSIAGRVSDDYADMASQLDEAPQVSALELNLSCPNVAGGVDFGIDPIACGRLVARVRAATRLPIVAKLTPNVSDVGGIARAAADAGADGISVINTLQAMAVDWRRRRPLLGNVLGGLSGPAIKPVALRCVYQVARAVSVPVIGIGGIATIDDVMEFLVAGATAVQIGTANFYDPTVSMRILDALPDALCHLGARTVMEVVGTLQTAGPQTVPSASCSPENNPHEEIRP